MALNLQKAGEDAPFCHPRPRKYPSAILIRRIPTAKPFHLLLVGHVEITSFLVQGTDALHLGIGEGEIEHFDVLLDVRRIG